jgi:rhodanese-related sulfurtransferase
MKRSISLLLVVFLIGVLAFGLIGCGPGEQAAPVEEVEEELEEVIEEVVEEELDVDAIVETEAKAYFAAVASDNNIMQVADIKEMLDGNPDSVFILDIRSAEDFEAGHIPGAYHSAWGSVGDIMDRLPRNRPVVVACYSGQTAGQTVGWLRMAGFDNVKSMASGMTFGWGPEGAGFPMEGTGPNPAADLPSASSPNNAEEEALWAIAQEMAAEVASGNNIIPPAELNEALEANPGAFYVLDIRALDDYNEGHIPGSFHSPWAEVGNLLGELPTNRPIVVACYSGQTAGQTVGVLRMLGFDANSLQFGIREGWVARAELPLVTE